MNFKELELGDIAKFKYGKMPKADKKVQNGYPIYTGYKISGYYSEYMYEEQALIIVARGVGGTGDVKLAPSKSYITNLAIIIELDESKCDKKFMQLYLHSLNLRYLDSGSAQSQITINDLQRLNIKIPSLDEQKKIASFITLIEKKHDNNYRIISNLEKIPKTLFKYWFIDFEFPNEKGLPYKSNGGAIVESELGGIPRGWKVGCIGEVCEQVKDKVNLDKTEEIFNYIGLEHMPQGSIALSNWESSEKVSGNKSLFKKDDILFGKLRPYFKKVGVASIDGVCSTDILVFNSKQSFEKSYLLLNLIQDRFIEYTSNTATGTRMPRSGWKQISSYKIVIPDESTLLNFEKKISPMLKKIQDITHENLYLKELRDILLPKLLSGEIVIPDESVVS
ncbi:restriction endonuclease subunit S [Priestia sp. YIM B13486]|uniref:restriction endonuclease subunit S n=1 Tax=Priestia sp. YIM B13486 TaxID=3366304 RepID=UPI00366B0C68